MFKKILLAYNGTKEGKSALLDCSEIAALEVIDIHLLAVAPLPSTMFISEGFVADDFIDSQKEHGQKILDEGVERLKSLGFKVTGHLIVGEPVEEICRLASELKADLIVIGHKQKAPLTSRWWRGSVGRMLLDHAPCSIYIARTRE